MARATLKLTGVYEAWGPHVRQGRLQRASGAESAVLVRVLEGRPADDASLAMLREDGRLLARLQHENVLRVEQTSGVGGFLALVHESFDCVAMSHVIAALKARGQVLPSRVAVELAAAVGIALEEALKITDGERRVIHPGPTPGEVLVDTAGRVKLGGVSTLRAGESWPVPPPGYGAPEGAGGWHAATWMVGVLLLELLTGERLGEVARDAKRHEAMLRRVVLTLVARPGDAPSEPLLQAVRQALAFDPESRGTPGAYGRMLRDLAVQLQTPGLRAWAPGTVPAVQRQAAGARANRTLAPPHSSVPPAPPLAPPLREFPADDLEPEPTMVGIAMPSRAAPRMQTPSETVPVPISTVRPQPQRVAPGPAVGVGRASASAGPSIGPAAPQPDRLMGMPALPLIGDGSEEAEHTVVARPAQRVPVAPPRVDPLHVPISGGASKGPAPVARSRPMLEDEDEPPRPARTMLPLVLAGLTAVFLVASVVVIVAAGWFFGGDEPRVVPVPTLADVVGEQPDAAAAVPAPEAPIAVPEPLPPSAPAPPAPAVTSPPKPTPSAVTIAPPPPEKAAPPAPPPAAKPPAPAAKPPASAAKASAPAPKPAATDVGPVRIGGAASAAPASATPVPPPTSTPAPAPAPVPAAAPPAAPPAVTGPFEVSFAAADSGMTLEVKCMQGGGSGATVTVPDAIKGNCRVVGRTEGATVMTLVTVSGPRAYQCFSGGARTCR